MVRADEELAMLSKVPDDRVLAAAVLMSNNLPVVTELEVRYMAVPELTALALKTKPDPVVVPVVTPELKVNEPVPFELKLSPIFVSLPVAARVGLLPVVAGVSVNPLAAVPATLARLKTATPD